MAGHGEVRTYIQRAMAQQRLPHAMLFHGPRSVGKRTCAVALAKILGCRPGASDADRADVARRVAAGLFPDLLIVGPSGPTNSITLAGWRPDRDDGDALQYYRFLDCGPLEGGRKILLLRDADRMNIALANYLLKMIEEPPPYLTIILTAKRRSDVLPTIRSRCAPLKFSPLSTPEMAQTADAWLGPDSSTTRTELLRRCLGRPGILKTASSSDPTPRQNIVAHAMGQFVRLGFISLFGTASSLVPGKATPFPTAGLLEETYNDLLAWFRDAVLVKALGPEAAQSHLTHRNHAATVAEFAQTCTPRGLDESLRILQEFRPLTARPMEPAFLLEHLLLQLGPVLKS
jgi:DNA polymerase III gamma/tau subunit